MLGWSLSDRCKDVDLTSSFDCAFLHGIDIRINQGHEEPSEYC
jgi:hypothetical protein